MQPETSSETQAIREVIESGDAPKHIESSFRVGQIIGKVLKGVITVAPSLIPAAFVWWYCDGRIDYLVSELERRPPVAVLDYRKLLEELSDTPSPGEVQAIIRKRDVAVRKLADQGYLVLDGESVLAAVEGTVIGGGEILPGEQKPLARNTESTDGYGEEIPVAR